DSVLQAVATTPQVRPPWRRPIWRHIPMNRIFAVAAALAVVVVAGLTLLARGGPTVGSTPSPAFSSPSSASPASSTASTPTSSAEAFAAIDARLAQRWMGGTNSYVKPGAGSMIDLRSGTLQLDQSNEWGTTLLLADASAPGANQLQLVGRTRACS